MALVVEGRAPQGRRSRLASLKEIPGQGQGIPPLRANLGCSGLRGTATTVIYQLPHKEHKQDLRSDL